MVSHPKRRLRERNLWRSLKLAGMATILLGILYMWTQQSRWISLLSISIQTSVNLQFQTISETSPQKLDQNMPQSSTNNGFFYIFSLGWRQTYKCRSSQNQIAYEYISTGGGKFNNNSQQEQYKSFLVPARPDRMAPVRVRQSGAPKCLVTSQVRIIQSKPYWTLQAMDEYGNEKSVGGDEFYITYTSTPSAAADNEDKQLADCVDQKSITNKKRENTEPTAVAVVHDHGDGTYSLDFASPPMTSVIHTSSISNSTTNNTQSAGMTGILTIHFVYSCGIGALQHPAKKHWKNMGVTGVVHSVSGLLEVPPIRPFQPPHGVDLTKDNDHILFFGDSVMMQMVRRSNTSMFRPFRTSVHQSVESALILASVGHFLKRLHEWHEYVLRYYPKRLGLVLGSAVWDLLEPIHDPSFQIHLHGCRALITAIRSQHPQVNLYWKSPTALHPHRLDFAECFRERQGGNCKYRTKYMSESRSRMLYMKQKELMQELNVPLLDVYEATYLSAAQSIPGDGRHFQEGLNELMFSWFYPRPPETFEQYLNS